MTICISKEGCNQNGVSISEALLLLSIHNDTDFQQAQKSLISKGYITANRNFESRKNEWKTTNKGKEILDSIIVDSSKDPQPKEQLEKLAASLKEIFPKGKKEGTNYYWAEGVALIVRRLKLFFKKYGNNYTNEQIIDAARSYVKGFNSDYKYMKLLKYFILKEKVGVDGEVEGESELINYIENAGQEDVMKTDWISQIN